MESKRPGEEELNNVGIAGPRGNAVEVDVEAWDQAMRINVASMMMMAKAAIPEMIRNGGGFNRIYASENQ